MSFILSEAFVRQIFDATAQGEWSVFEEAIDPNVKWIINDPVENPLLFTGTYTLSEWQTKIRNRLAEKLAQPLHLTMQILNLDIIGNKAIIEASGSAVQKNGNPYNNRYAWFLEFSKDTGKIVVIREYMNTGLIRELVETN